MLCCIGSIGYIWQYLNYLYFLVKKILSKKIAVKKNFSWKTFLSKKIFSKKIFSQKIFSVQKIFWQKIIFDVKHFFVKKNVGLEKFLVKKNFRFSFCHKNILSKWSRCSPDAVWCWAVVERTWMLLTISYRYFPGGMGVFVGKLRK